MAEPAALPCSVARAIGCCTVANKVSATDINQLKLTTNTDKENPGTRGGDDTKADGGDKDDPNPEVEEARVHYGIARGHREKNIYFFVSQWICPPKTSFCPHTLN